jgi:NAD(P)-dependent dehydrogenase (short-subunit alcohol dehydrogenase family)
MQGVERTGMNLFDMTGKVALVTGGSRGLGYEMALAFADHGADVIVASRKREACEAAASEIEKRGRRALPVECHVGKWDDLTALVATAYATFGRVDVLVNNAGMSPVAPSSAETSEDLFDKILAVNLKGPFRLTALIAPRMVAAGGGSVINVTSTGAIRPTPEIAPYAAAKGALNIVTRAHALEYGPRVRVNAIMAGPFWTDISATWRAELDSTSDAALRRIGRPQEVVTTALYLASDHSSYTTGSIIELSGGIR